ncbi:MAG: NUDIX domain-containing protein [Gammaproteobacteria bacterium]
MDDKTRKFEILRKQTVYDGFFRLELYRLKHTLFEGGWSEPLDRELFRRGNCVAVLLYDPFDDRVVLIEQFRTGAILNPEKAWLIEIVAGAVEEGETAEDVAFRESREEAGCEVQELIQIGEFYTTPGGASERITLFCGKVDASSVGGIGGHKEENEDILVTTVGSARAYEMVGLGEIDSAIPIIAIQWLELNKHHIRQVWGACELEDLTEG